MSRDELHQIAQNDTPQNVHVPQTLIGLVVWGATRFGVNLVIMLIGIGVLGWGMKEMYYDQRRDSITVMELVRNQATINEKLTTALSELAKQVENNTKAIADELRRKG